MYGPSLGGQLLDEFLSELEVIRGRREVPWCIGGDFNEVLFLNKRNKVARRTRGMDAFGDFADQNDLIAVPLSGAQYTSNFQESPALSKSDRFLVSMDWDDHFAPLCVRALPRPGSDHVPILLEGGVF